MAPQPRPVFSAAGFCVLLEGFSLRWLNSNFNTASANVLNAWAILPAFAKDEMHVWQLCGIMLNDIYV